MKDMKKEPQVSRQREWQRKMVKEGKCYICAKPAFGKVECPSCREKRYPSKAEAFKRLIKRRVSMGQCIRCKADADDGSRLCKKHREESRRYCLAYYYSKRNDASK